MYQKNIALDDKSNLSQEFIQALDEYKKSLEEFEIGEHIYDPEILFTPESQAKINYLRDIAAKINQVTLCNYDLDNRELLYKSLDVVSHTLYLLENVFSENILRAVCFNNDNELSRKYVELFENLYVAIKRLNEAEGFLKAYGTIKNV